ncbi:Fanconi anemia group J protein [Borealophlyctis nickersoniae]|nr:Fanconi anemia group J protein [Borealophlyctis nickersoniae]
MSSTEPRNAAKRKLPKSFTAASAPSKRLTNWKKKRASGKNDVAQGTICPTSLGWVPAVSSSVSSGKQSPSGVPYMISGVELRFPFKAYPSQLSMMDKTIKALQKSENALLESTGKTLALLVGALAWRESEKKRLLKEWEEENASGKQPEKATESNEPEEREQSESTAASTSKPRPHSPICISLDSDDDDFQKAAPVVTKRKGKEETHDAKAAEKASKIVQVEEVKRPPRFKLPKIYFASRTQKQLQQIVKELKTNTAYRPRMTILGSREHYCVNPQLAKSQNKNEDCEDLVNHDNCRFFNGVRSLKTRTALLHDIWDIEDLVKMGKKAKGCPYYTARGLADTADIIFLPYSYIVDPLIRAASDIQLQGNIVIIDEAEKLSKNIDSASDAGSFECTETELQDLSKDLQLLLDNGGGDSHRCLFHLVSSLLRWKTEYSGEFTVKDFDRSLRIWTGPEILALLANIGILPASLSFLQAALNEVAEASMNPETRNLESTLTLPGRSLRALRGLVMILGFLFDTNNDYANDYKMVLEKRKSKRHNPLLPFEYVIGFWCLNPGVIFRPLADEARSVILTSGTLSPTVSFASELNVAFNYRLEAPHVVGNDQMWAAVICRSSNGTPFSGTYKNFDTLVYQDQLGETLLRLIDPIPEGVLVFMPSYNWLDKLFSRWRETNIYANLEMKKDIFLEPRGNAKGEFERLMDDYTRSARSRGAIMFCVQRGKMSEGIDFADEKARAVIIVGVPFPNIKDIKVIEKKAYNDKHGSRRKLLSGKEWYDIQAFRAVNQSLGRCIRHRSDWGAIVLLDQRFSEKRHLNSISKWARNKMVIYDGMGNAEESLRSFFETRNRATIENVAPSIVFPPTPAKDDATIKDCASPDIGAKSRWFSRSLATPVPNVEEIVDEASPDDEEENIPGDEQATSPLLLSRPLSPVSPSSVVPARAPETPVTPTRPPRRIDLSKFRYTPTKRMPTFESRRVAPDPEETSNDPDEASVPQDELSERQGSPELPFSNSNPDRTLLGSPDVEGTKPDDETLQCVRCTRCSTTIVEFTSHRQPVKKTVLYSHIRKLFNILDAPSENAVEVISFRENEGPSGLAPIPVMRPDGYLPSNAYWSEEDGLVYMHLGCKNCLNDPGRAPYQCLG